MGFFRQLTGQDTASAIESGAEGQQQAGREAVIRRELGAEEAGDILTGAEARSIEALRGGAGTAQGFFEPFAGAAQQGIEQAGFLTDPQAQFDFVQSNPLFAAALENANRRTESRAASRGRLSAGDTLQDLSSNVLLQAAPLIGQQKQSIRDLLGFGTNIAGQQAGIAEGAGTGVANIIGRSGVNQANVRQGLAGATGNLLTDIAAARAAGLVGAENIKQAGAGSILSGVTQGALALGGGGFF